MTGRRVAYVNARLLDPDSGLDTMGALLVEDDRIVDLGAALFREGAPSVAEVVDCGGMCLAPGLIDIRVRTCEPGAEHKESIASAGLAAAAGGVTTIVALPDTDPVIDDVPVVEFVTRRGQEAGIVRVHCYGTVTRGLAGRELTEMGLLAEAGALAFTDGARAVADSQVMRRALSYASGMGLLIVQHPEDPSLAGGVMNAGEIASRLGLSGIPTEAEVIVVERDLRLVALTRSRYHVAHVSTAATIEAIRNAKQRGLAVTCDTAPHYFALNETAVGEYRTFAKVSPPLRDEMDRRAVAAGLADGTIDVIASDHTPQDQDSKRLPFALAEHGIIGLETLLPLTLGLYHEGTASLLDALATVTVKPAKLLGLPSGRLRRGAPADLVLFDPNRPWIVQESAFRSKSKNSPFDGRPVQGQVQRTVVGGRTTFQHDMPR